MTTSRSTENVDRMPPAAPDGASQQRKTLWYVFLAAVAGAAGTTLVGVLTSTTTLGFVERLVNRSVLPKGAVVFVNSQDCGEPSGDWEKYDVAAGRFVLAADGRRNAGQTRDGNTIFKITAGNLPAFGVTVPYRLSNTSASGGGFPLMRVLGTAGADSGAEFTVNLAFENREIDVTPSFIALTPCVRM